MAVGGGARVISKPCSRSNNGWRRWSARTGACAPWRWRRNSDGFDFFEISLEVDGSTRLQLSDQRGRPRASLTTEPDGTPQLSLHDALGAARADLAVSSTGAPALVLESRDG